MLFYEWNLSLELDTILSAKCKSVLECCPTKSSFVEKKWSKVGSILSKKIPNYLQNHRLWRKMVKIGTTILSIKSSKDPSWLAMCSVYFRNNFSNSCQRVMPFSIRVTSCQYKLPVIFFCVVCVSILPRVIDMSYRSVNIPTIDTFDNR